MNVHDAIRAGLKIGQQVVQLTLSDLSDADLLVRPVPGANHIAWQMGHVIVSEHQTIAKHLPKVQAPPLPAGFAARHTRETAAQDTGFYTKAEYLDLFTRVRTAMIEGVATLSESDLDRPSGWDMVPTVGALLVLMASHPTMHAGQFSVVRRKLGKPVLF
jgi:hypothetical protein